jgi:YggT family protein
MLLDTITSVEHFVDVFTTVYALVLFAYILTSWFPQLPSALRPVQRFLHDVCNPYLRFWRRVIPISTGPLDLSPMVGIFALIALDQVVRVVLERLR